MRPSTGTGVAAIWTNGENPNAVTFADLCSDFSGKALVSCATEVLSSFVPGTPASSFPKLKREREREKRRNQSDAYLLGIQTHGTFKFKATRIPGYQLLNHSFCTNGNQASGGQVTWLRSITSPTCMNARTQPATFYLCHIIHIISVIHVESIKPCWIKRNCPCTKMPKQRDVKYCPGPQWRIEIG